MSDSKTGRGHAGKPLAVAVSGSTGLVGGALVEALRRDGHRAVPMVRPSTEEAPGSAGEAVPWDPAEGELDPGDLAGLDAVVHLAGASLVGGRWNEVRKRRIRDSRVDGTALVAGALAELDEPPVLVCASAVGFYGDRGDELLDETSAAGDGFLAEVCRAWEAAADPARRAGVRVVHVRLGVVLSEDGGALAQMLPPFRLGLGGPVGGGRQWLSWIHLDDAVGVLRFAVEHGELAGAVNAVAPEPVRQKELARALGRVLHRPAFLPLPSPAVRMVFGEMGDEMLLASTRVVPRRLEDAGYGFRHPGLEGALAHELGGGRGRRGRP